MFLKPAFFFLFFLQSISAVVPSPDTFLYPRDWSILYLSGIEYSYKIKKIAESGRGCTDKQEILCMIRNQVSSTDFKEPTLSGLVTTQLTHIGERHLDQGPKKVVAKILEDDPSTIDTLALEMFNSSSQGKLDEFFEGKISLEEVKVALESQWSYFSDGYVAMLKAAKDNGTRIIGIDHRDEVEELDLGLSEELIERDRLMAEVINRELDQRPNQKMIIYTGKLHAFKSLGSELKTVADHVRNAHPEASGRHIMAFNLRAKNFFTSLYKSFFSDISDLGGELLIKKEMDPFMDGVFFVKE